MNFEYDDREEEREVVAVIWCTHLVVKGDDGRGLVFYSDRAASSCTFNGNDFYYYLMSDCTTKEFYKGDKITITF